MDYNFRDRLCGMVDKIMEVDRRIRAIPLPVSSSFVDNWCYDLKKEIVKETIEELEKDYIIKRRSSEKVKKYPVTAAEYGDME